MSAPNVYFTKSINLEIICATVWQSKRFYMWHALRLRLNSKLARVHLHTHSSSIASICVFRYLPMNFNYSANWNHRAKIWKLHYCLRFCIKVVIPCLRLIVANNFPIQSPESLDRKTASALLASNQVCLQLSRRNTLVSRDAM